MKTIKLSHEEELALRKIIIFAREYLKTEENQTYLESILEKIERAPDDTIMYKELRYTKNYEKSKPESIPSEYGEEKKIL